MPLAPGEAVQPDSLKIPGFKLVKHEARELDFDQPGDFTVDEQKIAAWRG
jgi:hypothetical protein